MTEDEEREMLARLRLALQATVPAADDVGILNGYVVISQWTDDKGDEWLMTTAGDINDQGAAIWAVKGWLNHTLDNIDSYFGDEED